MKEDFIQHACWVDKPDEQQVYRAIYGHVEVPCYLINRGSGAPTGCTEPGGHFTYATDTANTPETAVAGNQPKYKAEFFCIIPKAAIRNGSPRPGKALVYGHGLFNLGDEVAAD